jgi:hypothetical protein
VGRIKKMGLGAENSAELGGLRKESMKD